MDWSLFFKILKANVSPAVKFVGVCASAVSVFVLVAALVLICDEVFGKGWGFVVLLSSAVIFGVLTCTIIEYMEEKR